MKLIYMLALLSFVQTAKAQDFCKLIKKEVSADKTTVELAAPFDPEDKFAIKVNRNYAEHVDEPYDNFYIVLQTVGEIDQVYYTNKEGNREEKDEKSLIIEFDDKSKFSDDTIKIVHDFSGDRTEAVRYIFYPLTAATIKDFTTKKIAKYSLAGSEHIVAPDVANAIMHYVQCIKEAK